MLRGGKNMGTQNIANIAKVFIDTDEEIYKRFGENSLKPSDYKQLEEIIPSLKGDLDIIYNYLNGKLVYEESDYDEDGTIVDAEMESVAEEVVESVPEQVETIVVDEEEYKPRKMLKSEAAEIIEYITKNCIGKSVSSTSKLCINKFGSMANDDAIKRVVNKETFTSISDDFFMIENNKIKKVVQKKNDQFDNSEEAIHHIRDILKTNKGDVIKSIGPNMTADDIIKIAMVRWRLFKVGEYSSLGGGVKEIFIMEALKDYPFATNQGIIESIFDKYSIIVDKKMVSSVRNGRAYKDIYTRFER